MSSYPFKVSPSNLRPRSHHWLRSSTTTVQLPKLRCSAALASATSRCRWQPPAKIEELYAATDGNNFAAINAPTAGAREARCAALSAPPAPLRSLGLGLERSGPGPTPGEAPIQLYSLATPNGWKVGLLLEELEEAGVDAPYDAHPVNIGSVTASLLLPKLEPRL